MPFLFLKNDLEALDLQIADLKQQLKDAGQEMGASTQESSETWHDNFGHEDSTRRFGMISGRLNELQAIRNNAQLIEPPIRINTVGVGCRVVIEDEAGKKRSVRIGSYFTLSDKTAASYIAPLGQLLMNAEIGDIVDGNVGGKFLSYTVLKIESYL